MAYFKESFGVKAMGIILQGTENYIMHLITSLTCSSAIEVRMISLKRCKAVVKYLKTEEDPDEKTR